VESASTLPDVLHAARREKAPDKPMKDLLHHYHEDGRVEQLWKGNLAVGSFPAKKE